jgi:1-acyl-sn-glycerol-3-phosphate acyltransferase
MILRSLLFAAYFWALSAAMTIAYLPVLFFGSRQAIVRGMRRWSARVMWGLSAITETKFEVRGRAHIPRGAALVASKHMSMWETIVFHLLLEDPAAVMKRALRFVPLYGSYARKARMIWIDRSAGARALKQLVAESEARLKEGRQILIFPEGTRRQPGAAPDYKSGVAAVYAALAIPCTPVALNSGVFWGRRTLLRRPGTIVIEFLPPIPPGLPRETFMTELQARIEEATQHLLAEVRAPT